MGYIDLLFALPPREQLSSFIEEQTQAREHAKITSVALGIIAMLFLVISCVMWGIGASPAMLLNGVIFIPYFVGSFLARVALGAVLGALAMQVKMTYHYLRISQARSALDQINH